jgi:hypothetical protein
MLMGFYMLGVVAAFVAALIAFNGGERNFHLLKCSKQAGTLLAQAVRAMLLFSCSSASSAAVGHAEGCADRQDRPVGRDVAGQHRRFGASDAVAFRAEFKDTIPPTRLYWRGLSSTNLMAHLACR